MTLARPLLGLDSGFPDKIYITKSPLDRASYGCSVFNGIHGLACFKESSNTVKFLGKLPDGMIAVSVTFDEAREVAKSRADDGHSQIVALLLLDNPKSPEIHYIR